MKPRSVGNGGAFGVLSCFPIRSRTPGFRSFRRRNLSEIGERFNTVPESTSYPNASRKTSLYDRLLVAMITGAGPNVLGPSEGFRGPPETNAENGLYRRRLGD